MSPSLLRLAVIAAALAALSALSSPAGGRPPAETRRQAEQLHRDGNWREAFELWQRARPRRRGRHAPSRGRISRARWSASRTSTAGTRRTPCGSASPRRTPATGAPSRRPRQSWADADHYGTIVAGEFKRGPHRGGGRYANSVERDRVRALQLFARALELAGADRVGGRAERIPGDRFPRRPGTRRRSGRARRAAPPGGRRPDPRPQRRPRLAPAGTHRSRDAPGCRRGVLRPGGRARRPRRRRRRTGLPPRPRALVGREERRRALALAAPRRGAGGPRPARRGPDAARRLRPLAVRRADARVLRHAAARRRRRRRAHRHLGAAHPRRRTRRSRASPPACAASRSRRSTASSRCTGRSRTARAATPPAALERLAEIFENRRQFETAAQIWERRIREHGETAEARRRIDQIRLPVGGVRRASHPQPAGRGATVDFRFRNGRKVRFEAREIDVRRLLADAKDYLRGDPREIQWPRVDLEQIGWRLVNEQQTRYLGRVAASWDLALEPRPDHFDRRITVATPLRQGRRLPARGARRRRQHHADHPLGERRGHRPEAARRPQLVLRGRRRRPARRSPARPSSSSATARRRRTGRRSSGGATTC